MNTKRIITTTLLATLACGLLGCSWTDQFSWPWEKESTPVTDANWSAKQDWPAATQPADPPTTGAEVKPVDPPMHVVEVKPVDPPMHVVEIKPVDPVTGGQDTTLIIGKTHEVTTSVMEIKGKFITLQEILHEAKPSLEDVPSDRTFQDRIRVIIRATINERVNYELVYAEANSRLSKGQKDHVEAQVKELVRGMIANAGGSQTRLEKRLTKEHRTLDEIRERSKRNITVQLYQQIKFLPAVSITRPMLLGYYNQHKDNFRVEKKVAMQLIAVLIENLLPEDVANNPSPQELAKARAAAKETIEKVEKLLTGGANFTEVAKKYTDIKREGGGKLPLWPAGSLRQKELEKAGFALTEGQRSGIIATTSLKDSTGQTVSYGGFHIVKAYEVKEGKLTSFEDAQDAITDILREKQLAALSAKFSKKLNEDAQIAHSPEFIKAAIDEAMKLYWKPE